MTRWVAARRSLAGAVCVSLACLAQADAGWPFGRKTENCGSVPACPTECEAVSCQKQPKGPKEPPAGLVVQSIPAMMLAQPAVAVSPQRVDSLMNGERAERLNRLLDALEARERNLRQQQAASVVQKTDDELLQEKITELEKVLEALKKLEKTP